MKHIDFQMIADRVVSGKSIGDKNLDRFIIEIITTNHVNATLKGWSESCSPAINEKAQNIIKAIKELEEEIENEVEGGQ